jgi:hypothetical protein
MKTLIIIIFFILWSYVSYSQENKGKNSDLSFGLGLSQSDRRFDFLTNNGGWGTRAKVAAADKPWLEYDFFINYNRNIIDNKHFKLLLGMGYLININLFRLPVNNTHFNIRNLVGMSNQIYYKHNINIPIDLRYNIIGREQNKLSILLSLNNDITFYKQLKPNLRNIISVSKFSLSDVELYTGLRYDKNNIGYGLQYRIKNLQFRDDALINNKKEIDLYNPVKFRLVISRKL